MNYCFNCFGEYEDGSVCPVCGFDNASYVPSGHHIPPGKILVGKYFVGRVLGEGGFGITYFGYDLTLQRNVAIKEYYPSDCVYRDAEHGTAVTCLTKEQMTTSFLAGKDKCIQEARALAKLDDIPGIVRVLDFFEENNTVYVVMDFVQGTTLKSHLASRTERMSADEAIKLLLPVLHSLGEVHKRGFVHRDISPDNIMIQTDGSCKLLDFGAAKNVVSGGSSTINPVLKRGFSPIEQYSVSGLIGPWTDIYAFCATVYYCLTGELVPEPMDRLQNDTGWQDKLYALMPFNQASAIIHGLGLQKQDRYENAEALCDALTQTLPVSPTPSYPDDTSKPNQTEMIKKRSPRKGIIAAIVAAVVLTVSVFSVTALIKHTGSDIIYGRVMDSFMSEGYVAYDKENVITYVSQELTYGSYGIFKKADANWERIATIPERASYLNLANGMIYYISNNDKGDSVQCISVNGGQPKTLIANHTGFKQLLYVDDGKHEYFYYIETVGGTDSDTFNLYRCDTTFEDPVLLLEDVFLYNIHNGELYFSKSDRGALKIKLYKTDMDAKKEPQLVYGERNTMFFSFCRDDLYIQTEKSDIIILDKDGDCKKTVSFVTNNISDSDYFCGSVSIDSKYIFETDDRGILYKYDIDTGKSVRVDSDCTACYDIEYCSALNRVYYFYKVGDVPLSAYYYITDDTLCWTLANELSDGTSYGVTNPSNMVNGSCIDTLDDGTLCFVDCEHCFSFSKDIVSTTSYYYVQASAMCQSLNPVGDDTLFFLKGGNGGTNTIYRYDDCLSSDRAITKIYTGEDVSCLCYVKNADFGERLFFIDYDEDEGCYYIYSTDINGKDKKRISENACFSGSMIIYDNRIYYLSQDREKLYVSYLDGKGSRWMYDADSELSPRGLCADISYVYVIDGDELIRIDRSTDDSKAYHFDDISSMTLCNGYLFAVTGDDSNVITVIDTHDMTVYDRLSLNDNISTLNVVTKSSGSVYLYYWCETHDTIAPIVAVYTIKSQDYHAYVTTTEHTNS